MKPSDRKVKKVSNKGIPKIQYMPTSLKNICLAWSKHFMDKPDWEIISIDVARDTVVFRRYDFDKEWMKP